nr:hypothetical protein [Tanacetum cinerariifolium]
MMGKISFFLGLQISPSPRGIFINQSKYALKSLKKYGFESWDLVDTPMVEKSKLDEDKEGKAIDPSHYRGMIGTLLYLTASRPDLQFAICMCARQKSAAISSTEAEYIALSGCCAQILWMRSQLTNYGLGFNKIPMYYDNKSAIALCCNNVQHSRSKHIDSRYHFIKEQVENEVIKLYFVNTEYQLADLFTKDLGRDRIEFLINKLGMRSFTPETLKQLMDEVSILTKRKLDLTTGINFLGHGLLYDHVKACVYFATQPVLSIFHKYIKSKESTLQLVYDVLRLTPFFKAFLVTADVLEIYMQEFWATATVHHHSIRFKMDNKKHIVNLESFREMLHICPRLPHQPFVEPPFEEEILAFLCFLGHSAVIRKLIDVNINKLHQPWRSFVAIINKCLIGKSLGDDSLRDDYMFSTIKQVSRHQNTQQFGALQHIELTNEDIRNSNAYKEYYAVATRATPPKPKASVRKTRSSFDTTITPSTAAAGPRLTTSKKGKQAAKASKAKSLSTLSKVAMTEAQQLKLATKRSLYQTHISQASGSGAEEGTGTLPGVPYVPTDESGEDISSKSTNDEGDDDEGNDGGDGDDDGDDGEEEDDDDDDEDDDGGDDEQASDEEEFIHPNLSTHAEEETRDEEIFDPILKTPKNTDDEGNGEENLDINVGREEGHDEEEEEDELYRDVNINQGRGIQTTQEFKDSHVTLTPINPDGMESIFETTSQMDVQTPTSVAPLPMSAPTITPSTIATITTTQQAPLPPTTAPSTLLQDLPNFGSLFGNLYKALVEAYESNKIILDTYGDTVTLKRRHDDDDADRDEEPSAGSDRGSKRHREGKEPDSASTLTEKATRSAGILEELEFFLEEVYKATTDQLDLVNPEGNLTNLIVEERFAFNVSLRMFTRSIVIQRHVEDLQLGVESYQKKLNLTKPDTYRSNLKRKEAYIAYSNPRGFIYQNKDKQNRLMQIDELHKFSDGMLIDVRTALDDLLKGIQMKYLPQSIWRKNDKDRASAMIQAIDKRLKTMMIMRSLERFVGGRLYEGDFKMLQRTI